MRNRSSDRYVRRYHTVSQCIGVPIRTTSFQVWRTCLHGNFATGDHEFTHQMPVVWKYGPARNDTDQKQKVTMHIPLSERDISDKTV